MMDLSSYKRILFAGDCLFVPSPFVSISDFQAQYLDSAAELEEQQVEASGNSLIQE